MAKTLFEAIAAAKATFYQNADVMVAGFLIRHPDIDPADVELVMMPISGGGLRFSIEPKELHVPPLRINPKSLDPDYVPADEDAQTQWDYDMGWNDCRQAMIAKKKESRPADTLTTTLAAQLEQGNG